MIGAAGHITLFAIGTLLVLTHIGKRSGDEESPSYTASNLPSQSTTG